MVWEMVASRRLVLTSKAKPRHFFQGVCVHRFLFAPLHPFLSLLSNHLLTTTTISQGLVLILFAVQETYTQGDTFVTNRNTPNNST